MSSFWSLYNIDFVISIYFYNEHCRKISRNGDKETLPFCVYSNSLVLEGIPSILWLVINARLPRRTRLLLIQPHIPIESSYTRFSTGKSIWLSPATMLENISLNILPAWIVRLAASNIASSILSLNMAW